MHCYFTQQTKIWFLPTSMRSSPWLPKCLAKAVVPLNYSQNPISLPNEVSIATLAALQLLAQFYFSEYTKQQFVPPPNWLHFSKIPREPGNIRIPLSPNKMTKHSKNLRTLAGIFNISNHKETHNTLTSILDVLIYTVNTYLQKGQLQNFTHYIILNINFSDFPHQIKKQTASYLGQKDSSIQHSFDVTQPSRILQTR